MSPSAGHEEIRKAYVARALAMHPDRVANEGPEAVAAAEFRMQELNAAWEVLRDPERRRGYDRAQKRVEHLAPSEAHSSGADLPEPVPQSGAVTARAAGWWVLPLAGVAVLAIVVVAVVVGLSFERRGEQPLEVQTGDRFAPGMCVAVRPGLQAEPVPCDSSASGRIVEVVPHPRPCRDGDLQAVVLRSERLTLCLEPAPESLRSP